MGRMGRNTFIAGQMRWESPMGRDIMDEHREGDASPRDSSKRPWISQGRLEWWTWVEEEKEKEEEQEEKKEEEEGFYWQKTDKVELKCHILSWQCPVSSCCVLLPLSSPALSGGEVETSRCWCHTATGLRLPGLCLTKPPGTALANVLWTTRSENWHRTPFLEPLVPWSWRALLCYLLLWRALGVTQGFRSSILASTSSIHSWETHFQEKRICALPCHIFRQLFIPWFSFASFLAG